MRRIGWFLAGATATAVALWRVPAVRDRLVGPDPVVDLPPAGDQPPTWPDTAPDDVTWAPPARAADPAEAATTTMPAVDEAPADEGDDQADAEDTAEVDLEPVPPPDDAEADGLRGRIQETRARMREKARSEAERTRSN